MRSQVVQVRKETYKFYDTKRKGQFLKIMDPEICYAQVRTCTSVPGMKLADLELKAAHV